MDIYRLDIKLIQIYIKKISTRSQGIEKLRSEKQDHDNKCRNGWKKYTLHTHERDKGHKESAFTLSC